MENRSMGKNSLLDENQERSLSNDFWKWIWILIVLVIGVYFFWRWYIRKTRKTKTYEILIPVRTEKSEKFCSAISTLVSWEPLLQRLFGKNTLYKYVLCGEGGSLLERLPLIVVCPVCSRLEEDIDTAIRNFYWKNQFVVVLVHSCLERFLPKIPTGRKLPKKHKYQSVEFVDIAIDINAKLYRCQMNEDARIKLRNFIEKFYNT